MNRLDWTNLGIGPTDSSQGVAMEDVSATEVTAMENVSGYIGSNETNNRIDPLQKGVLDLENATETGDKI